LNLKQVNIETTFTPVHTENTLSLLFEFLDIDEDIGSLLNRTARPKEDEPGHLQHWSFRPGGEILPGAAGKWKRNDYVRKRYIEQMFRYTFLIDSSAENFGLTSPCNGNNILLNFGYDIEDHWNPDPAFGLCLTLLLGREKLCSLLRKRVLYVTLGDGKAWQANERDYLI